jgi:hypothetical protein
MSPDEIRDASIARFNELAGPKYDRGQVEHGGLLTDRNVVDDMEKEIIDLWHYCQTLRIQLAGIKALSESVLRMQLEKISAEELQALNAAENSR